jgi:aryl sulfotransferase
MLVRPATREYRTWVLDSRRWQHYRPRPGDIVVTTYPKCGTTWMQRIVNLLIFQSPDPRPVSKISPWYDMRFPPDIAAVNEVLESQTHRRAVKSHLPFDGLPIYDELRYIYVARDGRDACLSFHNHATGFTADMLERLDKAGLGDALLAKPYPRAPADPAAYFRLWLTMSHVPDQDSGYQNLSFFDFAQGYWKERSRPNLLLVHYGDMQRDLAAEMRRVADFLEIAVSEDVWPQLVDAASFETMKRQGDELMPQVTALFTEGKDRFFHKGQAGRWKGVFRDDDLQLYDALIASRLPPDCAAWLHGGRHAGGCVQTMSQV